MANFQMDTRLYAWSETEIRVAGNMVVGVVNCQWKADQEKEEIYGKGTEPLAIKSGNSKYSGTLTLLQNELEKLLDQFSDANGNVNFIPPFEVQISFANDRDQIVTYKLAGCQFNSQEMNAEQNMKKMEVPLPFMYLTQTRVAA
ncbi:hypothetical protein ACO2Q8_07790 [Larkinella sp. VNQ87]|uniref:hypothetical protein n=1 Tax=Larkinella sp. VNQ87 TaxID=3400921 RepID=UPI003C00E127